MKIKIEDNFLEQEKFDEIEFMINPMVGFNPEAPSPPDFAWYFRYRYYADPHKDREKDKNELDQFQFTHTFYDFGAPQSSHMEQLNCVLDLLKPVAIFRIFFTTSWIIIFTTILTIFIYEKPTI